MRTFYVACCLFMLYNPPLSAQHGSSENAKPDPAVLTKNFMAWWAYYNDSTLLSADFVPMDTGNARIPKSVFFDSLLTGNYVPIRRADNASLIYYLYKLSAENTTSLNNIRATISNAAFTAYEHFRMEGNELPDYHFTDLKGNVYTRSNTAGKILVIKCWFINCAPCVAEMPELNELVNSYRLRKDILFVSIALDSKKELEEFLIHKTFRYAVVPDQKDWLSNTLRVHNYPTHIIIDPKGKVVKVVNSEKELKESLTRTVRR
jgi:peroxiredoxin